MGILKRRPTKMTGNILDKFPVRELDPRIYRFSLSDHLIHIAVEKYKSSTFKCRVARIFPMPGCKDPSYQMKKFLTYIWEYFLRTGGCRFYTLLATIA